jgi:hypothetical protein
MSQALLERPDLEYKGIKDYAQPQGWGCVGHLRGKGYKVPLTQNGTAGSILVDSTAYPPEGEYVVIVTYDGPLGHVALGTTIDGQIVVRDEAGYGKKQGHGRVVDPKLYKGFITTPAISGINLTESVG